MRWGRGSPNGSKGGRNEGRFGRALFGTGSVLAIVLGVLLMSRNTERSPSLVGTAANAPEISASGLAPSPSDSNPDVAESPDVAPLESLVPTTARLREEVARDPERTPESLVRFSREVRARTDRALRDGEGGRLFGELERCVSASEAAPQAQVICVSNADRLAGSDPALAMRARALHAAASPEARSALDSYGQLRK